MWKPPGGPRTLSVLWQPLYPPSNNAGDFVIAVCRELPATVWPFIGDRAEDGFDKIRFIVFLQVDVQSISCALGADLWTVGGYRNFEAQAAVVHNLHLKAGACNTVLGHRCS